MPARDELPATSARSGAKARRTWGTAHDSAAESYGDGERAHRTASSALKHTHEKVGDHWEPKEQSGPSDDKAAHGARNRERPTAGGVDANASKQHLLGIARRLDIRGRSSMHKDELVTAIRTANDRATATSRRSG